MLIKLKFRGGRDIQGTEKKTTVPTFKRRCLPSCVQEGGKIGTNRDKGSLCQKNFSLRVMKMTLKGKHG